MAKYIGRETLVSANSVPRPAFSDLATSPPLAGRRAWVGRVLGTETEWPASRDTELAAHSEQETQKVS